jgi:hypothetical protein
LSSSAGLERKRGGVLWVGVQVWVDEGWNLVHDGANPKHVDSDAASKISLIVAGG